MWATICKDRELGFSGSSDNSVLKYMLFCHRECANVT
jgi:hypothetical protein